MFNLSYVSVAKECILLNYSENRVFLANSFVSFFKHLISQEFSMLSQLGADLYWRFGSVKLMYFCCEPIVLVFVLTFPLTVCCLLHADQTLFKSLQSNDHCLHSILPEVKVTHIIYEIEVMSLFYLTIKPCYIKNPILFVIYFKLYENNFSNSLLSLNLIFCFCVIFLSCVNMY
jgi:hypothetical protein